MIITTIIKITILKKISKLQIKQTNFNDNDK